MEKTDLLLVDNEPDVRGEWRKFFYRSLNIYDIHEAGSGEEALSILERIKRDKGSMIVLAVLLDVKMEVLDGIETLERIKGEFPFAVVYIITGNVDEKNIPDTAFETGKLGGAAFFKKANMDRYALVEQLSKDVERQARALSSLQEMR